VKFHTIADLRSDYCIYWNFHQDGTIEPLLKLTGMLNTYVLVDDETAAPWGTEVAERVTAHNHQHIVSVRLNPMIDGVNCTVVQSDSVPSESPVGSEDNFYGNAFYAKKTPYKDTADGKSNYNHETSRTWDLCSGSKTHPIAKKPTAFKIVNKEGVGLLAKPGSLVWKRAPFARHGLWVTPYNDTHLYPAGHFVPQTSGDKTVGNDNILDWSAPGQNIENTDVLVWANLGISL